jgi:16S rRNA (cytidine1402-2'-O)-methyltransferase
LSRGELVFVVAGAEPESQPALSVDVEKLLSALLEELPASQAAKLAARISGSDRAALYEMAVQRKRPRE